MQSALNRQAMTGEVNPLFKKYVHEGDNPSTYIPATKRREIYDYMSQVNFTKHLESPKKPTQSTAQEANQKTLANRTDYRVGIEGNENKQFQAQPRINFGQEASNELRMRAFATNVGPSETKKSYAQTSASRKQHKQEVYSVNIPFSKYGTPNKPGSAQGGQSSDQKMTSTGFQPGFAKSHASAFMSPKARNSVTSSFGVEIGGVTQTNMENLLARKQNQEKLNASSVNMKFPANSPYNASKNKDFKPNQNRKEMILNAKKADFQGQLLNSSLKFTLDEKNNRMTYNNNAGGGGDKDLIYNIKAAKPYQSWAETHDKASKNHLTQMQTINSGTKVTRSGSLKPIEGDNRFRTITDSYFSRGRNTQVSPKDAENLRNHYKFHKGTTYSIGNERDRQRSVTLAQESYVNKQRDDIPQEQLPGRRNQESLGIKNQNKVPNFAIGHDTPAVRGGDITNNTQKRSNSMYNTTLKGRFTNQFMEANDKNKNQRDFIHSNKFDYGYDPKGGHRAVSMDKANAGNSGPAWDTSEREEFKKRDQKQHFKIASTQPMAHSETKRVGDTLDRFVKNEIDQDFLKRSHLPFASIRSQIDETQRPQIKTSFGVNPGSSSAHRPSLQGSPVKTAQKEIAHQIKRKSEVGHVPFGAAHRGRHDDARDRNNTLTKTSFSWKVPTVMQ